MTYQTKSFDVMEAKAASNFKQYLKETSVKHVVYLSGIIPEGKMSRHLRSRQNVGEILTGGDYALTILQCGIIVGSGSASFEMIRDICEKLPIIPGPFFLKTKTQPISIRNVINYLVKSLFVKECYDRTFDIGGPDVMKYADMLKQYAEVRNLKRRVIIIPFINTTLIPFYLFFLTSVSFRLSTNLIESMRYETICRDNELEILLGIKPFPYKVMIRRAFSRIQQNMVLSSWRDSMMNSTREANLSKYIEVPEFGCYKDIKVLPVDDPDRVMNNIWALGGEQGYYYANWLWRIRGGMDRMVGGVGLSRGRNNKDYLARGEALDFWRVIYDSKKERRLLLFGELKVPGEAWLEFRIDRDNILHQVATFRPHGIWGRLYWLFTSPFHYFIFNGMIRNLVKFKPELNAKVIESQHDQINLNEKIS